MPHRITAHTAPISYAVNGKQYMAITVGNGGAGLATTETGTRPSQFRSSLRFGCPKRLICRAEVRERAAGTTAVPRYAPRHAGPLNQAGLFLTLFRHALGLALGYLLWEPGRRALDAPRPCERCAIYIAATLKTT